MHNRHKEFYRQKPADKIFKFHSKNSSALDDPIKEKLKENVCLRKQLSVLKGAIYFSHEMFVWHFSKPSVQTSNDKRISTVGLFSFFHSLNSIRPFDSLNQVLSFVFYYCGQNRIGLSQKLSFNSFVPYNILENMFFAKERYRK